MNFVEFWNWGKSNVSLNFEEFQKTLGFFRIWSKNLRTPSFSLEFIVKF